MASILVGSHDLNLSGEAAEAAQGSVDDVGLGRGRDHHDVGVGCDAVHERQQLGDDALFHLAVGLVALRRDHVHLVDPDDRGLLLCSLLEAAPEVPLRLASLAAHHLRAVDQEEEGSRLARERLPDHRLPTPRGTVEEDASRRADADAREQLWVLQRELDQLTELDHLLAEASDVIKADLVGERRVLVTLQRVALGVDDGLGRNHAVLCLLVVDLHDLEVDGHVELVVGDLEDLAGVQGAVVLEEVGLEEDLEDVALEAMDGVLEGHDVHALGIADVGKLSNLHAVLAHLDLDCLAHDVRESRSVLSKVLVGYDDADCLLASSPINEHGVSVEHPNFLHPLRIQSNDAVVLAVRSLNHEPVRGNNFARLGLIILHLRIATTQPNWQLRVQIVVVERRGKSAGHSCR
mmetsp:Transcript_30761/g.73903  ORF Transcript_30761/g.73903 Transcript_30761/m.73903 type:complete len:406 (+) Transcript_30761:1854-3071(+)